MPAATAGLDGNIETLANSLSALRKQKISSSQHPWPWPTGVLTLMLLSGPFLFPLAFINAHAHAQGEVWEMV